MLSYCMLVLITVAGLVQSSYPDGNTANEINNGEGSSNSYGYGYSGSFSGGSPPPNFVVPQFDFQGFLNNYLGSLAKYHEEFMRKYASYAFSSGGGSSSFSYASSSPTASANASSSLVFDSNQNNIQATAAQSAGQAPGAFSLGNRGGFAPSVPVGATNQPGGNGASFGGSFGSGSGGAFGGSFAGPGNGGFIFSGPPGNGAAASASYGPGGIQQTAAVYPENPNVPNINTRFGAPAGQPGGFHSVFTSSQSHTTNVNGKPVTLNRASTTVNDNGKITTYTANNP